MDYKHIAYRIIAEHDTDSDLDALMTPIISALKQANKAGMKETDELWRKRFASNTDYQSGYESGRREQIEVDAKIADEAGLSVFSPDCLDVAKAIRNQRSN